MLFVIIMLCFTFLVFFRCCYLYSLWVLDENETLAPHYEIDDRFFSQKVKELVLRYNYTLNPLGVYEAIKYMYTYWPDPHNKTHIREQYIHVIIPLFISNAVLISYHTLRMKDLAFLYFYLLFT